jgi:aminopeptidase YwaD
MTLYGLLKALDFERLSGTAGEERGRQVIIDYLKGLGLTATVEPFEFQGFESGTAEIISAGKSWAATPYGLCGDADIEGDLVFLENADALLNSPARYQDKIVLFFHSDKRLFELYEQTKVKAFIGISSPRKSAYSFSHRQKLAEKEIFPVVMVSYSDAEQLVRLDGKNIKLSIRQKAEPKTAHNIVLDIPGTGRDNALTLLVGHYDTVARSHGASDNAAGSVILLKAAEFFARHKPTRDLRVVWFSGEELGLLGSFAYAKQHEEEIKQRLRLVVNVDLAGDPIGRNAMFVLGSKELQGYASGILKEHNILFSDSLSLYSSDCMPFSVYEIPSLNLARMGGKALFHGHTADDVAKNANEYGLRDVYQATVTILERVLNAGFYPIPLGIDDSLRDKIESYLWQSRLEKPELQWREKYRR